MTSGNLLPPVFSLALSRANVSLLTFGDTAPAARKGEATRVALSELNGQQEDRQRYPVQPEGIQIADTFFPTSHEYFIGSGAPRMLLPREQVDMIARACVPPAKYDETLGSLRIACDAVVPKLGLKFAGKTFYMEPHSLVNRAGGNLCGLLISTSGPGQPLKVAIIGRPFLQNVIADFYINKREVWLTERA